MIDVYGGNNLMCLPLDQLVNRNQSRSYDEDTDKDNDSSIMNQIDNNKNNFNLRKRDLYNE